MAGHSKWANIQHRKGKQDARRSKMFSKLAKEITVATKMGMPDPAFNPRLRLAVQNAKAVSMPKDVIDRAIKKGSANDGENYEEIRYEGRGPDGVGIIVEALTDNRNRTASEVRAAFTKNGGALGETGSASFGFDRLGVIEYKGEIGSEDDVLEAALDAGAADVESDADSHTIYCDLTELNEVAGKLEARFGEPEAARIGWRPQTWIELTGEKLDTMIKLYDAIDDLDDVQNVYANFDVAEGDIARLRG